MADRLWKILGLKKKKKPLDIESKHEEPVECVVVENTGSLSNIKQTFLKKTFLGSEKPERKKSQSETCLHPRAPLCPGESNISISSLQQQHGTGSSESMIGNLETNQSIINSEAALVPPWIEVKAFQL